MRVNRTSSPAAITLAAAAACIVVVAPSLAHAQPPATAPLAPIFSLSGEPATIRQAQELESDRTHLRRPSGVAFSPGNQRLYVLEGHTDDPGVTQPTDIVGLTLSGDRSPAAAGTASVADPINVAFDRDRGRLLVLTEARGPLLELRETRDGVDGAPAARHEVRRLALEQPRGMAIDPATGDLFVLDAAGPRILRVSRNANGDVADVSTIALQHMGAADVRGIAFEPSSGLLHVLDPVARRLFELTTTGRLVADRDLGDITLHDPQAMVFAPSGDRTDDPRQTSLYLADRGRIADGRVVELSLAQTAAAAASSFVSTLVRTTDTSAWSPPSPDPSGLEYLPSRNTLVTVDGEVEETVGGITHFRGANVWETTLAGTVVRTGNVSNVAPTVVPMSNEPTGIAFKASNGHHFITDDSARRVFDLAPGPDAAIGTADDTWKSFSTSSVGNDDPEGIAYDTRRDRLFVADGVNQEIYEYTTNGSLVQHFDVAQYGVTDPESVEYDADAGTLLVLGNFGNRIIAETTTAGALVQTLDVGASQSRAPAGLAVAPASDGSGRRRFYIVDRGIDNDSDPRVVDGRLFEMTAPPSAGTVNAPPLVDAGSDQTVVQPDGVSLNGSVTDDGLPNPPGAVSTQWSKVSGPGDVTFADTSGAATTATFTATGSYVLRLSASDSELSSSDDVMVEVTSGDGAVTREVSVASGSDDAEESPGGSVSLSSTDLELVTDGTSVQTVGIRFPGLSVPRGAAISSAFIQFQTDEVSTDAAALTVQGQAADSAPTFTATSRDVSSRPRTTAHVQWSPSPWSVAGERAAAQRTPNLASVVQEIVDRPGWSSSNGLAFLVTGTGRRTAEAYEGGLPPVLRVVYTAGGAPANQAPSVNAGPDQAIVLPAGASLDGTVTDDGLPTGSLSTAWTEVSGPGTVSFADPSAVDTTATFSQAGTYVLRLTAGDGSLSSSDDVTITVDPAATTNQPPTVDAGRDQAINPAALPASASLNGTVTDDGLPTGSLSTAWTEVSGPGTVGFADPSAVDTTATFSKPGTFVLRLTAGDGALAATDDVTVTVSRPPKAPH